MKTKRMIPVILGAALLFGAWQVIGHWVVMPLPMAERHVVEASVGTLLTLAVAWAAISAILRTHRHLENLVRIRDYLIRMEEHYLSVGTDGPPNVGHFYSQALSERFNHVAEGFTAQAPEMRSRTMANIADLATETVPGRRDIESKPLYPLFRRATSHLAVAAYSEPDPMVRSELDRAVKRLADFAREQHPDLLAELIRDLAHANRTALRAFRSALAGVIRTNGDARPEGLEHSLPMADFGEPAPSALTVLHDLRLSDDFREATGNSHAQHDQAAGERDRDNLACRTRLLCGTRELLSYTLRSLSFEEQLGPGDTSSRAQRPPAPLDLSGCFLAWANLKDSYLKGASLQGCHAQYAALEGATLDDADLGGAFLRNARMQECSARRARLWGAFLDGAGLSGAHLEGADLRRAQLEGAYLVGAHLEGTRLWKAVFQAEQGDKTARADFSGANWWDATFFDSVSNTEDRGAMAWLETLFPKPANPEPVTAKGKEAA